jgi:hypothetical protein
MRNLFMLFVALSLAIAGCKDDDSGPDLDPNLMHLDGFNNSAPFLQAGTAEAAARFSQEIVDFYAGKQIEAIQYFMFGVPTSCELIIYEEGQSNAPGPQLYWEDITARLQPNTWNTIDLATPVDIPDGPMWISIRMDIDTPGGQYIGCDAGPAEEGGDWLFESSDNQWLTFRTRSGVDINWNIRAMVSE